MQASIHEQADFTRLQVAIVTVHELRHIMRTGQMLLPALSTCYMALEELRERGLL